MANGYYERGEVYWVRMDNGFGGEQGVGRPGLILTNDDINSRHNTVTIAFLSKQNHVENQFYLPVDATGCTSYVIINQIMTYDKGRIGKYLGRLNREEQKRVDDALEDVLDLGYVDDTAVKEKESEIADRDLIIEEMKAEMAKVRTEVVNRDGTITAQTVEIEMWKRLYERSLDQLVQMKLAADVERRTMVEPKVGTAARILGEPVKVEEVPKVEKPVVNESQDEPQDERVDINHCTATALKKIGFSLAMARRIVESRPFKSVTDLKRVNGLKANLYRVMEPKLRCVPVEIVDIEEPVVTPKVEQAEVTVVEPVVKKVNINTAKAADLRVHCGFSSTAAYSITGYRNKNGPFQNVEDLLKVKQVSKVGFERCKHLLEV